jgi:hypothetical protein
MEYEEKMGELGEKLLKSVKRKEEPRELKGLKGPQKKDN